MDTFSLPDTLSVSVRIYRAVLVAYPKTFREHYETQMVQAFRDLLREAYRRHGMPGALDVWLHTLADLLVTILIERMLEGSRYMFSPKVLLWGGVASIFCGLFWLMMVLGPSGGGAASGGLALALGLGGLVGLRSLLAGQGERLGLAGFALGIIGTVLALAVLWWTSNSGPLLNSTPEIELALVARAPLILMLAIGTSGIGLVLLGVANLRAKTLHGWRGLPLGLGVLLAAFGIAGWLILYVPLSQGRNPWDASNPGGFALLRAVAVLIGLGWMGLGITLAAEADAHVAQPSQLQPKSDI